MGSMANVCYVEKRSRKTGSSSKQEGATKILRLTCVCFSPLVNDYLLVCVAIFVSTK